MSPGRVVAVGLGPAGADLVLPAARRALAAHDVRYVRTARHPAVADLAAFGLELVSFDDVYGQGDDLDAVYAEIVRRLGAAARAHGAVAYGVPGSPAIAERTVELLRAAAAGGELELQEVPGLSFVDLAWSRLAVDPMRGARLVDARDFAVGAAGRDGPLLVAQCDSREVLSDVKLTLLETVDPETPVAVLQRLGLPGERVEQVALAELDRVVDPDHLTSVFVDTGRASVAAGTARLVALAERLRGPGGCPWDAAQTHRSLARHLLEEAYETVDAIGSLPAGAPGGEIPPGAYAELEDELGDLLFQVVIHSVLAREAGAFGFEDVAAGIHEKLVRRHPHVFGTTDARTADDVTRNWEQIKKDERGADSVVDSAPSGLPSLLLAQKLYRKADAAGYEPWRDGDPASEAAVEVRRLGAGEGDPQVVLGRLLAAAVALARARGVDGETALRGWAARFAEDLRAFERRSGGPVPAGPRAPKGGTT